MKKSLCIILALVILVSISLISVNAAKVDEADIGAESDLAATSASCVKTQAEAVAWLKAQEGARYNLDGAYGSQCSDFSSAYVNYVLTGNPYGGRIGVYNANQYSNASLYPSDWKVIKNTTSLVPQPGDIFVVNGADSRYGHTGVVISSTVNNATIADQNGMSDWSLNNGSPAHIHNITWTSSGTWAPKYFIRPNFASTVVKPSNAWIKESHTSIPTGASNTFTFGATNASWYNIRIDKDGSLWKFEQGVSSGKSYTFSDEGNYTVSIAGYNSAGSADSTKLSFTVFKAIILGQDFIAEITNAKAGKNIGVNNSDNVILQDKADSDYQKWHFKLQSDNTYKITNIATGKNLDVYNADTADGTNIQVWKDNNSAAQFFYIRYNNYGFSIIPKANTSSAIDIANGYLNNGTNIQEWNWNASNAQTFSIDGYYGAAPSITKEYNGHTYEYYEMAVPWEQAVRICEQKGGHLVSITSQEENDIVSGMISGNIWLGARGFAKDNVWYWTNCEKVSYANWRTGEPNYYKDIEFYVMMYSSGDWNDCPYSTSFNFVCEYDNGDVNANSYTPNKTIERNGVIYGIFDYAVDWQTAEAICEAKGGHLVKIDSTEKHQIFLDLMNEGTKAEYWFDATDRFSEGNWTDHKGNPLIYTNWQDGEPNNDFNIELYGAVVKSTKQWADFKGYNPIYRSMGFICEYEPKTTILGDIDGDGNVTSIDVTYIQRDCANIYTGINDDVLMNADVDRDGDVSILDATFIQRYLANTTIPYKIGRAID